MSRPRIIRHSPLELQAKDMASQLYNKLHTLNASLDDIAHVSGVEDTMRQREQEELRALSTKSYAASVVMIDTEQQQTQQQQQQQTLSESDASSPRPARTPVLLKRVNRVDVERRRRERITDRIENSLDYASRVGEIESMLSDENTAAASEAAQQRLQQEALRRGSSSVRGSARRKSQAATSGVDEGATTSRSRRASLTTSNSNLMSRAQPHQRMSTVSTSSSSFSALVDRETLQQAASLNPFSYMAALPPPDQAGATAATTSLYFSDMEQVPPGLRSSVQAVVDGAIMGCRDQIKSALQENMKNDMDAMTQHVASMRHLHKQQEKLVQAAQFKAFKATDQVHSLRDNIQPLLDMREQYEKVDVPALQNEVHFYKQEREYLYKLVLQYYGSYTLDDIQRAAHEAALEEYGADGVALSPQKRSEQQQKEDAAAKAAEAQKRDRMKEDLLRQLNDSHREAFQLRKQVHRLKQKVMSLYEVQEYVERTHMEKHDTDALTGKQTTTRRRRPIAAGMKSSTGAVSPTAASGAEDSGGETHRDDGNTTDSAPSTSRRRSRFGSRVMGDPTLAVLQGFSPPTSGPGSSVNLLGAGPLSTENSMLDENDDGTANFAVLARRGAVDKLVDRGERVAELSLQSKQFPNTASHDAMESLVRKIWDQYMKLEEERQAQAREVLRATSGQSDVHSAISTLVVNSNVRSHEEHKEFLETLFDEVDSCASSLLGFLPKKEIAKEESPATILDQPQEQQSSHSNDVNTTKRMSHSVYQTTIQRVDSAVLEGVLAAQSGGVVPVTVKKADATTAMTPPPMKPIEPNNNGQTSTTAAVSPPPPLSIDVPGVDSANNNNQSNIKKSPRSGRRHSMNVSPIIPLDRPPVFTAPPQYNLPANDGTEMDAASQLQDLIRFIDAHFANLEQKCVHVHHSVFLVCSKLRQELDIPENIASSIAAASAAAAAAAQNGGNRSNSKGGRASSKAGRSNKSITKTKNFASLNQHVRELLEEKLQKMYRYLQQDESHLKKHYEFISYARAKGIARAKQSVNDAMQDLRESGATIHLLPRSNMELFDSEVCDVTRKFGMVESALRSVATNEALAMTKDKVVVVTEEGRTSIPDLLSAASKYDIRAVFENLVDSAVNLNQIAVLHQETMKKLPLEILRTLETRTPTPAELVETLAAMKGVKQYFETFLTSLVSGGHKDMVKKEVLARMAGEVMLCPTCTKCHRRVTDEKACVCEVCFGNQKTKLEQQITQAKEKEQYALKQLSKRNAKAASSMGSSFRPGASPASTATPGGTGFSDFHAFAAAVDEQRGGGGDDSIVQLVLPGGGVAGGQRRRSNSFTPQPFEPQAHGTADGMVIYGRRRSSTGSSPRTPLAMRPIDVGAGVEPTEDERRHSLGEKAKGPIRFGIEAFSVAPTRSVTPQPASVGAAGGASRQSRASLGTTLQTQSNSNVARATPMAMLGVGMGDDASENDDADEMRRQRVKTAADRAIEQLQEKRKKPTSSAPDVPLVPPPNSIFAVSQNKLRVAELSPRSAVRAAARKSAKAKLMRAQLTVRRKVLTRRVWQAKEANNPNMRAAFERLVQELDAPLQHLRNDIRAANKALSEAIMVLEYDNGGSAAQRGPGTNRSTPNTGALPTPRDDNDNAAAAADAEQSPKHGTRFAHLFDATTNAQTASSSSVPALDLKDANKHNHQHKQQPTHNYKVDSTRGGTNTTASTRRRQLDVVSPGRTGIISARTGVPEQLQPPTATTLHKQDFMFPNVAHSRTTTPNVDALEHSHVAPGTAGSINSGTSVGSAFLAIASPRGGGGGGSAVATTTWGGERAERDKAIASPDTASLPLLRHLAAKHRLQQQQQQQQNGGGGELDEKTRKRNALEAERKAHALLDGQAPVLRVADGGLSLMIQHTRSQKKHEETVQRLNQMQVVQDKRAATALEIERKKHKDLMKLVGKRKK